MRTTNASQLRGASTFGFAVAGLVLGHALAYVLALPDPYHRDIVLARTGHDYLPAATQLALIFAFAAVATAAAQGILARREAPSHCFHALAVRLVLVQVSAFVGQEFVERLASGAPLADLLRQHLLVAGVAAQIAVALAAAVILRWLARTAARLADVRFGALPRPGLVPAFVIPTAPDIPRRRNAELARASRAPPLL